MKSSFGSVRIRFKQGALVADLYDTPTSRKLLKVLPCESQANTWGKEVYFPVPMKTELEADAKEVVDPGTVCFWVEGRSVAIPFGPTPVSKASECRLVTRVNLLGKVRGNPDLLDSVRDGDRIWVESGEELKRTRT